MVQNSRIIEAFRNGIQLPFEGEIYEYAANFDLQKGYAIKGAFDVGITKYLIPLFKALRNPTKRMVCVLKAIQTFGSGASMDLFVPYLIEHDPGDILWLFGQGNELAEQYLAERILPLYWSSSTLKPWMQAAGRFGITRNTLMFPHMSVMVGGLNEGNIHSLSKRYVLIDELWIEAEKPQIAGLTDKAIGRTKAFPQTKKIILCSQGGLVGTDWDMYWKQTNRQKWAWQCDSCKKHQVFQFSVRREDGSWAGMKWDTNETTRPNGRWNYTEASKTARLECIHCGHQTSDTVTNRKRLDDTCTYIAENPNADETLCGFQWPSIAKFDISFASLVSRYLQAKDQQDEHGYLLPLIQFHQQELAVNWDTQTAIDFKRISHEPYEISSEWKDERFRFMTVDCQKDFKEFWFVIRAWAANGESRQLDRGRLESWEQVSDKQKEWKVLDQRVFVDGGYEQTKVSEECVKHGHVNYIMSGSSRRKVWVCWAILKGSRQETFTHQNTKTGVVEKRIYSKLDYLKPNIGKGVSQYLVPFFSFSALHVSDILRRHRDGEAAKFLCLPDASESTDQLSYTNQMQSHVRVKERDERGNLVNIWQPVSLGDKQKYNKKRPGHFWDCEKEQITAALIHTIIGGAQDEQEKE